MTTQNTNAKHEVGNIPAAPDGSFKRPASTFRDVIERGGRFEPERDRYHLYVSYACPWATRALIARKLKGLEDVISVTKVSPHMDEVGWAFASVQPYPGAEKDPLYGYDHVKDLYLKADPDYTGSAILWDKKDETIVNNESSEIIRILNTGFNELLPAEKAAVDLYPEELRSDIDPLNDLIYAGINNGVYRAGFATSQDAYERAVYEVFDALDKVEELLKGKDYLVGDRLTEADVRLFVTIVRFDPVYHGHYKCNFRTIRHGYPAIDLWLRKIYWTVDAFKSTTNFDHIKEFYYWSQIKINPTRVVPVGPVPHIRPL
ncbi:glutathione S-transferase [Coprinellus micaceus]|uniref:Glutathione S-transferase n=1 Tax=Coprinellus micaceus TaxID=71717 RepID=A0A4Y7TK46_COPMI|nr:glutathione S-transferase [Coprinellus micaceus]